jgi:ornithine decarboxylase
MTSERMIAKTAKAPRARKRTLTVVSSDASAKPLLSFKERVREFLSMIPHDGPCVVVDLNVVRDNYQTFKAALPEARVFYAVKANPDAPILKLLARQGSCFDVASTVEIDMALAAGATPDRISFGNTIKKERDIVYAYEKGIRMFAVDCAEEVEKVARAAPGAGVYCRILCDGAGAEWPLSRKFGCEPEMAVDVLAAARDAGLIPLGVSFHPGSQQCNTGVWDTALASVAKIFAECDDLGIALSMVNMGGGYPAKYLKDVPSVQTYGDAIRASVAKHFGDRELDLIIEPGRGMVGDAGIIRTEVVLISRKSHGETTPWVYLDLGKFGGLAETMDESIRYAITTSRDQDPKIPCIVAGPTCDSADVLYEKKLYPLPETLNVGDKVWIESTGAYTTTYAAVGFNGFAPLKAYCIDAD